MTHKLILGTLLGAVGGGGAVYALLSHQTSLDAPSNALVPVQNQIAVRPPQAVASGGGNFPGLSGPIARWGIPAPSAMLRIASGYIASFDFRTRNPQWVAEHFTKQNIAGTASRENLPFKEDPQIPEIFRPRLDDYKGSGYDRGHLMPAADAKDSQEKMADTFYLTNISPQVGQGFNRDYWARLEQFVRNLAKTYDDVYCVTGTAFLPKKEGNKWFVKYEVIGNPPNVSVPTHFYKVVLATGGGKKTVIGAFLVPNEIIGENVPLQTFVVPVDWVEKATGHKFFTGLPPANSSAAALPLCSANNCVLPPPWQPKNQQKQITDGK